MRSARLKSKKAIFPLLLICFFTLFSSLNSTAQRKEIDSTFTQLINTPNSKEKVDELTRLFRKSSKKDYLKYEIIDSAISIGKQLVYIKGIGKAYQQKGLIQRWNYDYYNSIKSHERALSFLEKTTDTIETIKCLNSIAIAYRKVNIGEKSFSYYFKAYVLSEKVGLSASQAIALNGIGNIFTDVQKYKTALYYFRKALAIETAANNTLGMEYDYANIGEAFMFLNKYDSAFVYAKKALDISLNNGKKDTEGYELALIARIYQRQGQYALSTDYYKQALAIFDRRRNKRYYANALISLGQNELKTQQESKGLKDITEGLKIAKEIGSKENVITAYSSLATYYAQIGQYKKALETYQNVMSFKDSMLNESSQKALMETKIAYDVFDKDKQIQQLSNEKESNAKLADKNHKRLIYSSLVAILLIVGLITILVLYRKNTQLKIENLNTELKNYLLTTIDEEKAIKESAIQECISSFELSEREAQVITLISEGFTNKEIAKELFISQNTVKFHTKNVYEKLHVKNRIEAMQKIKKEPAS